MKVIWSPGMLHLPHAQFTPFRVWDE